MPVWTRTRDTAPEKKFVNTGALYFFTAPSARGMPACAGSEHHEKETALPST